MGKSGRKSYHGTVSSVWLDLVIYRRANRQYVAIDPLEVWEYIRSRSKMTLAFVMRNEVPHASPVWFEVLSNRVYFRGQSYKVKMKLDEESIVCCVWEDGVKYRDLKGVIMWGRAHRVTDPKKVEEVNAAMEKKYSQSQWKKEDMPPKWVEERLGESRTVFEVVPEKFSSWDNSKL